VIPAGAAPAPNPLKSPAGRGAPGRLESPDLRGKADVDPDPAWVDAAWAAALCAVDPQGLGGVVVRAAAGPVRDLWTRQLQALLPAGEPLRRMPARIADERLLGGLDLTATLQLGRPVAQRGLLAESHGGLVLVPMAERLPVGTAARLASALDQGEVGFERDGSSQRWPCRIGVVAFDEGTAEDAPLPGALSDRLAFHVDLSQLSLRQCGDAAARAEEIAAARRRWPAVTLGDELTQALCGIAMRLGVASLRASVLALRAARAIAALGGHDEVQEDDALMAARLVLAPRATVRPPSDDREPAPEEPPPPAPPPDESEEPGRDKSRDEETRALEDRLVAATLASLPAGLLASLPGGERARAPGRVGALSASPRFGRPVGSRPGEPRGGARLDLIDTLRAAAPWQKLRRATAKHQHQHASIHVQADDLRVSRLQQRAGTATIFVIDASGSSALHRLAEAKGAVNLLLADCYVRRDQVAVVAFRGRGAEVLLPPTRSLVRAKRSLAALPGGGGTPLAAGLETACRLAEQVRRSGASPVIVLLTDGRANIARDGEPGRAHAEADALLAARQLRALRLTALVVDTSPQPAAAALRLAREMDALYRALPHAGAAELSAVVQALPRQHG
jgi:magnesium chelatase subunit D